MNKQQSMALLLMLVMAGGGYACDDEHESHHHNEQAVYGMAGDPKHVSKTVVIETTDQMKFSSGDLTFKKSETVKFVVKNNEKLKHEVIIGTLAELKEHAEYMKKFPNMEHDDPNMISVNPGKTGEIIWKFNRSGEFYYACLIPGHMEAGMINKITVE